MVLQSDGKLLLAGSSSDGTDSNQILIRLESDGSLDTSFDGDGIVERVASMGNPIGVFTSVALQADGKIIAAGYGDQSATGTDYYLIIARFDTSGALDASFATNGVFTYDGGSQVVTAQDVVIQNDGKIVATGTDYNGTSQDVLVIRLDTDGAPDNSFGTNGIVTWGQTNTVDWGRAIQPYGDTLVVVGTTDVFGPSPSDALMLSFDNSGALNSSFGNAGVVTLDIYGLDTADIFSDVTIEEDKLVAVGQASADAGGGDYNVAVARFDSNGSLDTSFGVDGWFLWDGARQQLADTATGVWAETGWILVAGTTDTGVASTATDSLMLSLR